MDFILFFSDFWDWDNSAYVREKCRKKHNLHQYEKKIKTDLRDAVLIGRMVKRGEPQ